MDPTALTQAQLDTIAYKASSAAAQAAQAAVNKRFDELEKDAIMLVAAVAVIWLYRMK
jgi:hypothetical protein